MIHKLVKFCIRWYKSRHVDDWWETNAIKGQC